MKVLFITRKHPPAVGGMENQSYNLLRSVPVDKRSVVLRRSQRHLPWFLPYALARSTAIARREDLDCIHLGDALLAPLGAVLRRTLGLPVAVTVHGLDVIWRPALYQATVSPALRAMDRVVCTSQASLQACLSRGVPGERCCVIPCGIDAAEFESDADREQARREVAGLLEGEPGNRPLLVTAGRLVPRKGHGWFLEHVLPLLKSEAVYVIAGRGPQQEAIRWTAARLGLADQVRLLGEIERTSLLRLLRAADIFVMPNVPTEGDIEGFGIVGLEAAASGCVVVATRVDGIPSAIVDGQNGWLVEPLNAGQMADRIGAILEDPAQARAFAARARSFTLRNYSWESIGQSYLREFERMLAEAGRRQR